MQKEQTRDLEEVGRQIREARKARCTTDTAIEEYIAKKYERIPRGSIIRYINRLGLEPSLGSRTSHPSPLEITHNSEIISRVSFLRRNTKKIRSLKIDTTKSVTIMLFQRAARGAENVQPYQGPPAKLTVNLSEKILYADEYKIKLDSSFVSAERGKCTNTNGIYLLTLQYDAEDAEIVREDKKDLEAFLDLTATDTGIEVCVREIEDCPPSIEIRTPIEPTIGK